MLMKRGVSEVHREAARLHESLLQLRLEKGKLMREEVLLREKVGREGVGGEMGGGLGQASVMYCAIV